MSKLVFRQSMITTFQRCPRLYKFKYIDGYQEAPNPKMALGTVIDNLSNKNLVLKRTTGVDLTYEEAKIVIDEEFDKVLVPTAWTDKETPERMKKEAYEVAREYLRVVAPTLTAETVQEQFYIKTDLPYDFTGTFDLTTTDGYLRDLKVSNDPSYYKVHGSIQPALYSYAYKLLRGVEPKGWVFDVMKRPSPTKTAKYHAIAGVVSSDDIEYFFKSANELYLAIQNNNFPSGRELGAFWCAEGRCACWEFAKKNKE